MFYKILDFPKLPDYLVNEILEVVNNLLNIDPKKHQDHAGYKDFKNRKLKKISGQEITSVSIDRFRMSKSLDAWLKSHVHPLPRRQHIALYNSSSSDMGPHVDPDRNTVWMYVIEPGGNNVETVWYQEIGQAVYRPDMQETTESYLNSAKCDYSQLVELERFQIPQYTWVAIDSSVIHSVEGLTSNRLAIQVTP